jgi:hypothetical protein
MFVHLLASRDNRHVILRPQPVNRAANAVPGACLLAISLVQLLQGQGPGRALGLLGIVGGLVLLVRGYNLSAETNQGELLVHGYLRSRAVARSAIVEITDSGTVVWNDGDGRRRRTLIWAFNTPPGTLTGVAEHHADCRKRLMRWVRGR